MPSFKAPTQNIIDALVKKLTAGDYSHATLPAHQAAFLAETWNATAPKQGDKALFVAETSTKDNGLYLEYAKGKYRVWTLKQSGRAIARLNDQWQVVDAHAYTS